MAHTLDIRIGTMVPGGAGTADYIRQIKAHGFESFEINFWQKLDGTDLARMAEEVKEEIGDADIKIGALAIFGNPLENTPIDVETRQGWEALIDCAHLFDTDVVAGFTGRLRGQPLDASIPRFKEVFGELGKRAADKGVRLAFENCPMGGDWNSGDWNIAHNPAAWELMFDAVPLDNLGLEWEPCHQMTQLIDPMPQLRQWTSKIFHLHGKCATIHWDVVKKYGILGQVPFVYHRTPGFGDCNWTDIISDLRMGGFKGAIDIEGWHDPVYRDDLEMTGQVHGLNYLKRCRGGDFIPNPAR
jgi:sugar phosphate isomerase/epimerase